MAYQLITDLDFYAAVLTVIYLLTLIRQIRRLEAEGDMGETQPVKSLLSAERVEKRLGDRLVGGMVSRGVGKAWGGAA